MINDKVYQAIFDGIRPYLSIAWDKVVIYLEYGDASYSISFYVKKGGSYVKCYDLEGVSDDNLYKSFKRIDRAVAEQRKAIIGDKWTNMTMIVEQSGKVRVDYDYTDLTQDAYQYSKKWKKKYLV